MLIRMNMVVEVDNSQTRKLAIKNAVNDMEQVLFSETVLYA